MHQFFFAPSAYFMSRCFIHAELFQHRVIYIAKPHHEDKFINIHTASCLFYWSRRIFYAGDPFLFSYSAHDVCVWRDPFMVYVSVDEKSVQGRVVRKKIEDGGKRKIKNT